MASPCASEATYVNRVLVAIGTQKQQLKRLYQGFLSSSSRFTLPSLSYNIEHSYLTYFLCVNDICLLARMLDDQRLLPNGLKLDEFLDIDVRFQFHWFWCQIFPNPHVNRNAPHFRLIFSADNGFEQLMEQTQKMLELRGWCDLISSQVASAMTTVMDYLAYRPWIPVSHELRQVMTVAECEEFEWPNSPEIVGFGERWDAIVKVYEDGRCLREILSRYPSCAKIVWEGIRTIRCADKVPLRRSFGLLLKGMEVFLLISDRPGFGNALLCNVLRMLPGRAIIVPFVIFNATVAGELGFMREDEIVIWRKLEECIGIILRDDPEFFVAIAAQRRILRAEYEEKTTRVRRNEIEF
jgi:hypothetical protein